MHTLIVSTEICALHHWANAPDARAYLRRPHAHDFRINIKVHTEGDDRELEFHDLREELETVITQIAVKREYSFGVPYDFDGQSCEQICVRVLEKMPKADAVSVYEDAFHGSETYRESVTSRKIITVCGSTRFKKETQEVIKMLEDRGVIALAVGSFMHADGVQLHDDTKAEYDELHLDKIRMSNGIFVVNPDGYIGMSTRNEINLAKDLGLQIEYLIIPSARQSRSAVLRFSAEMEKKLLENDHKGGWGDCRSETLFDLLLEEKNELEEALTSHDERNIIAECADVANFAMMIADNASRRLGV